MPAATATDQQPGLAHPIGKDSDASRQAALLALRCAAGLAAAMGLGRFVFTAVLPMMQDSDGVSAGSGSLLATGNYLGYLVGALAAMALSASVERRIVWQVSSMALVASLVLMGVTEHLWLWVALRAVAGVASALLFIVVVRVIVRATWSHHHSGWAYGGVGAGIVLASLIASVCDLVGGWRAAWVLTGLTVAVLLAVGSPGRADAPSPTEAAKQDRTADTGELTARGSEPAHREGGHRTHARLFSVLVACYFLEGAGYIIAGTFLVATAHANNAAWVAHSLWLIVGLAAVPSCVLWSWLSRHVSRPMLLMVALAMQAAGIALTGASTGTLSVIATGLLFGGTFMGATTLALATGNDLAIPASVAILSAAYAIGQVVGPSVVTPLMAHGYPTGPPGRGRNGGRRDGPGRPPTPAVPPTPPKSGSGQRGTRHMRFRPESRQKCPASTTPKSPSSLPPWQAARQRRHS